MKSLATIIIMITGQFCFAANSFGAYQIKNISANFKVDCQSRKLQPADSQELFVDASNGSNIYLGKDAGYSYTLDQSGNVVLTKKGGLLSEDVSIVLGTIDPSSYCSAFPQGAASISSNSFDINLKSNIKLALDGESNGLCIPHPNWPNESGFSYLLPIKVSLTLSDDKGSSLTLKRSDFMSFSSYSSCTSAK